MRRVDKTLGLPRFGVMLHLLVERGLLNDRGQRGYSAPRYAENLRADIITCLSLRGGVFPRLLAIMAVLSTSPFANEKTDPRVYAH